MTTEKCTSCNILWFICQSSNLFHSVLCYLTCLQSCHLSHLLTRFPLPFTCTDLQWRSCIQQQQHQQQQQQHVHVSNVLSLFKHGLTSGEACNDLSEHFTLSYLQMSCEKLGLTLFLFLWVQLVKFFLRYHWHCGHNGTRLVLSL